MSQFSSKGYNFSKLDKQHQRQNFSCGIVPLDEYLLKKAGQDHRRHLAVTYILNNDKQNQIVGYYTLSNCSVELVDIPVHEIAKLPRYPLITTTLIGRLAIDLKYRQQGWGEFLLLNALQRAYQASHEIASQAVMVDAINDNAKQFYLKYGFVPLSSNNKKLYLSMKSISHLNFEPITAKHEFASP